MRLRIHAKISGNRLGLNQHLFLAKKMRFHYTTVPGGDYSGACMTWSKNY
jgi:hypothetical protein